MKKINYIILLLFLPALFLCAGEKSKTVKIGSISWYTEQNSFAEIVEIAKKENKPVLAVFSALWCSPCQEIKKKLFSGSDFRQVADKVVLLYIEQTDPQAGPYLRKNRIDVFPTFKMFSKEGIDLDIGFPQWTVKGFLKWIADVQAGNHLYAFTRRLEKEPRNRELMLKIEHKLRYSGRGERLDLLRRVVKVKPGFSDPLAQQAYEKIAAYLYREMSERQDPEDKKAYARKFSREFFQAMEAYYPGKFRYTLKNDADVECFIGWHNALGEYEKARSYFAAFLKRNKNDFEVKYHINIFPHAFSALLHTGREKEAEQWLEKLHERVLDAINKDNLWFYSPRMIDVYEAFIRYYGKRGQVKKGERYAALVFNEILKQKRDRMVEYYKVDYAKDYLLFAADVVKRHEAELKTAKGERFAELTRDLSAVYSRQGKKTKAKKLLYDLYENKSLVESLTPQRKAMFFNDIASTMLEAKLVEKKTLEIARKAVRYEANERTLDTLASVYAELGNRAAAVVYIRQALKMAYSSYIIGLLEQKLEKWRGASPAEEQVN